MDPSLGAVKDGVTTLPSLLRMGRGNISLREKRRGRRILGSGRCICIVLEMRHLLGTSLEKATRLLLE
jgi:hypothetical protein